MSERFSIPMSPTDMERIETVARALGEAKTHWARKTLLEALEGKPVAAEG